MQYLNQLQGKKTYIICGIGILWAIVGAILGQLSPEESLQIGLTALTAAGIRDGIAKK